MILMGRFTLFVNSNTKGFSEFRKMVISSFSTGQAFKSEVRNVSIPPL
jgi:hypothetical protein